MTKKSSRNLIELKPPRVPRYIELPADPSPALFDDEGLSEPVDIALASVAQELGAADGDAKVTVFRCITDARGRREEYLTEYPAADFSIGALQEHYGAGEFRVKVFGLKPDSNMRVIHANKKLHVAAPRGAASEVKPALTMHVPSSPVDNAQAVAVLLAPVLGGIAEAIKSLAARGNTRGEALSELKELATIAGLGRPADGGMGSLKGAIEFAGAMQAFAGGNKTQMPDDPEAAPYALMGKALDAFMDFVKMNKTLPVAPAPAPALSAPPAQLEQPGIENLALTEDAEMKLLLKGQLLMLLAAASANDDPEKWAGRIFEDAPDEIIEALRGSDWFEKLVQLEARFNGLRPWADKVRERVIVMLEEDAAEAGLTAEEKKATLAANEAKPGP